MEDLKVELRLPQLSPCVLINMFTSFPAAVRLAGDMAGWQPEELKRIFHSLK
jgi:hypothetical protein